MSRYINYGIDLGTTNSSITHADGGELKVIQNNDQMNVTPSVVRILKSGSLMTGRRAYNAIADDTDNVAAEFKRLMGQKFEKTFPASGRSMTPEELSAEVLKSLLADARRRTGEDVRAAVITVPAAFTVLQCEATARAARLAGLEEYPLLQEPIAAAIAYGARADARDQRWLVFDLGGGTLDVAVVSTRQGRLSVLEHRGDNHLGGKDIDRLIVQNIFLPFLGAQFALPEAAADARGYNRLVRKLTLLAEYSKIELSSASETIVSFIDLGDDAEGTPVEAELSVTREQVEQEVESLVSRCLQLAEDALAGARLSGRDLDRVLLVGGPTQMPYVRAAVAERLGAKVDYSLDPMTVVARGAAIYGSTVERASAPVVHADASPPSKLSVRLAFDAVSATTESVVAGRLGGAGATDAREVKADAEGGYWTSGWHTVADELFEIPLVLQEGVLNRFTLSVRDERGRALEVEPNEFQIRHGLAFSAPPLPHTISIELARPDGTIELSPVFPRKTLLPAEKTVSYRAAHTLRPSEAGTSLAIKLWEGEALTDPQANNWVGNMHIRSDHVRRPVPEGAEVQLHIKIDASRLITVEVFVPHLNEHFFERIYIPQDEEPDYVELLKSVPVELESYVARLDKLEERLLAGETTDAGAVDEEFPDFIFDEEEPSAGEGESAFASAAETERQEVERLRREIEDFDLEISARPEAFDSTDPDYAKGVVERSRELRVRIANLESKLGGGLKESRIEDAGALALVIERDVDAYGSASQKDRFAALYDELKRSRARGDSRGVERSITALKNLRGQILHAQDWFWEDWFDYMQRPGRKFVNTEEAAKWLAQGAQALENRDRKKLEEAVRYLWALEPVEDQAAAKERAVRPGLRQ
jgi:molecular chaperone DnaK